MSNFKAGPKVIPLGEEESISSIERWRQNVLYHLRLDPAFRPYLRDGVKFGKKSKASPYRQFKDDIKTEKVDGEDVSTVVLSKEDKCWDVDLMLDQVSNFCPLIPRRDITHDSASLDEVWAKIRLYHNLEKSGALLNECFNIQRKPGETPQALFARLKQSFDDNLLMSNSLQHTEGKLSEDEEMSPTLLNSIILRWLELLHPRLRDTVTQRFSTQLRSSTYGALFPEISRSVCALLDDLNSETHANRLFTSQPNRPGPRFQSNQYYNPNSERRKSDRKFCDYCKLTGKKAYYTHSIEKCLFIKREKSRSSESAKQVTYGEDDSEDLQEQYEEYLQLTGEDFDDEAARIVEHQISSVNTNASPVIMMNKDDKSYNLTVDTGCTGSIIPENIAKSMNAEIKPTFQRARAANGELLDVIGKTEVVLFRGSKPYKLSGLVCAGKCDLLVGMPFLKENDIAIRPATNQLIINGTEFVPYDPVRKVQTNQISRITQFTVQSPVRQIILPGESAKFPLPGIPDNQSVLIEARWDSKCNKSATKDSELWPSPQIVSISDGSINLPNHTPNPITVNKAEHFCQIHPQVQVDAKYLNQEESQPVLTNATSEVKNSKYSTNVVLNQDKILKPTEELPLNDLLNTYDKVFSPVTSHYNGKMGPCFVEVNMGESLPPQKKGRLPPFYSRDDLQQLQDKFDELEAKGVFSRPQNIGVTVENIHPSFLVSKQNSTDKRLVTDFSSITEYCRPTPSLLPDVDSTLRTIGGFNYLIKTDMSSAYFQIKLKKSSQKFCGVHTPYRGLRVYNVGCMGLPGVEVALEELTSLILGDMVKEGKVAKLADDLFVGASTPEELVINFEQFLHRLLECNIKLSPSKTIIAPKSVTILGWIWSRGQLKASPHKISALSTIKPPETVTALKSFIGAFRFISRVLPRYANTLSPLEAAIRGKNGKENINWSDDLINSFKKAQQSLLHAKTITIPKPSDTLWIVTDAAVRPSAIGATLYAVRDNKPLLSGFFNAKLPDFQTRWLPCEVEGLAVAAALNHYAPLIIQSANKPQVLTDSKPVVQAVQKLRRGEFSTSSRMTTFLSNVSKFGAQIQHIPGAVNLPSDFSSRHPLTCNSPEVCQVCKFILETSEVVSAITIADILNGKAHIPYTNRAAWKEVQAECPDLRKVLDHIKKGTNPNKKSKNLRTVRKYLSANILVSPDGLLIRRLVKPLIASDQIVIPQLALPGIITALHLRLNHPTSHQMSKVFTRYFYAINHEKIITEITNSCHHCSSIKDIPSSLITQTTSDPPSTVGSNYSADVVRRCKQKIFIIRETTTSFTLAELINGETVEEISGAIIKLSNILKPSKLRPISIKLDPAPSNKSLFHNISNQSQLVKNNINIELGRSLNPNKNPIIDKCISELHTEILNIKASGGPITSLELSEAIANLNGRIRTPGMSAYEQWTQRDQVSGEQLPINDRKLILEKHQQRIQNHAASEKCKSKGKPALPTPKIDIGTLVYVYTDRDKTEARPRYMVCGFTDQGLVSLRRFSTKLFSKQTYDVKPNDIYTVPNFYRDHIPKEVIEEDSSSEDEINEESYPMLKSSHSNKSKLPMSQSQPNNMEELPQSQDTQDDQPAHIINNPTNEVLPPPPPAELINPETENNNPNSRLRPRKPINYNEDIDDTNIERAWLELI